MGCMTIILHNISKVPQRMRFFAKSKYRSLRKVKGIMFPHYITHIAPNYKITILCKLNTTINARTHPLVHNVLYIFYTTYLGVGASMKSLIFSYNKCILDSPVKVKMYKIHLGNTLVSISKGL